MLIIKRFLRKGYEYFYNSNLKKVYYAIQDNMCKIPKNFSFLVFGCHGVGLQSLLYFLSKHTYNGRNVFPIPMDWTRQEAYTTALLNAHKKIFPDFFLGKWGLTYDGSPKNLYWIDRNISKKVPAIILVRDPILAIISNLNLYIFRDIDQYMNIDDNKNILDVFFKKLVADCKLNEIFGYRSNLDYMHLYILKFLIIDTTEIVGEYTNVTMSKIANFLEIKSSNIDFNVRVNSAFTQSFPISFFYCDAIVVVSPFLGKYKPYGGYHYCEESGLNYIDDCYFSPHFPNERLYISIEYKKQEKSQKKFNKTDFYSELDVALKELKNKIIHFEKIKIRKSDLLKYLRNYEDVGEIKKKMEYEMYWILKQRPELKERWEAYREFVEFIEIV